MTPVVSIIMGSTSDLPVMEKAAKFLDEMEIPFEMHALSAHRTPAEVEAFAKEHDLKIIGDIPRSNDINRYEEMGMTTIEGDINLEVSQKFLELAKKLLEDES